MEKPFSRGNIAFMGFNYSQGTFSGSCEQLIYRPKILGKTGFLRLYSQSRILHITRVNKKNPEDEIQ